MQMSPSIFVGGTPTSNMFSGDIGVKELIFEENKIYKRQGGYFYLELDTTEGETE